MKKNKDKRLRRKGEDMLVKNSSLVKFHFTGRFDNGKVFGSTIGKEPIECRVGEEKFAKGLEEGLVGMKESEKKEIVVPPEKGYGWRDETLIKKMPRDILKDKGKDVKIGQLIEIDYETGLVFNAQVLAIHTDSVTLDLNHPLAGKTVKFDVEVVKVD